MVEAIFDFILFWYGVGAGAIFGFALGRFKDDIENFGWWGRTLFGFAVALWPIVIPWYYLYSWFAKGGGDS